MPGSNSRVRRLRGYEVTSELPGDRRRDKDSKKYTINTVRTRKRVKIKWKREQKTKNGKDKILNECQDKGGAEIASKVILKWCRCEEVENN